MTVNASDDTATATVQEQSTASPETTADTARSDKKPGAPRGNLNACRHGLRTGGLPPGASYIQKQLTTFRLALERAVLDERGRVDVFEAASIQTAVEHTAHALKCRRWLKESFDALTHDQRLSYSREIGRAFDARDRVLKQLGLDSVRRDAVTILYTNEADDGDHSE